MSVQIVIVSGPDKGQSFEIAPGNKIQVGRSHLTTTKLTDQTVSRVHCEIEFDGKQAVLVNLSGNGTLVNNKEVHEHKLKHGDLVRIGATEFRFQVPAIEDASTVLQAPGKLLPQHLAALPGQKLAHFAIEKVIATGQTGVVFKAEDVDNGQAVAIKILQPEFSRSDEEMQRFIRAMKTVLGLSHPNLVPLLSAGKTGPYCWMAMEYIEGESMNKVIQRIGVAGMLDWKYGYRVAVHVARALEHAHGQSIIHRNVTPTNILLRTADKTVLLGDLMLAKALEGALAQQVTRPGQLVGDVAWMSPERTRGTTEVDGRSDVYGLGATVYSLVTGRPPFTGPSLADVIVRIRTAEPEKPTKYQMGIPGQFQDTLMKMLAKNPEDRYQSATALLGDLARVGKFAGITV